MLGSILAAVASLLIFASWFVLPAETEPRVEVIKGVSIETEGVGRVATYQIATEAVETSVDTTMTESAENEPYIAPQTITEIETEAEPELVEVFPEADPIIESDIDALIVQVASEYGLPWQLVRAVCWVESGFDPNAISSTGDYGLMQVSYVNHGWLGLTDPLDPEANLRAGCTILKTAIENSDGDFTRALMRYNRGDAYAMSQWSQGIFSTAYTERVLERYYAYMRGDY
jgi:soluble lytic murein transglycosylase-like protein